MNAIPDFRVEVYQNEYLPENGSEVNAIVTVTSEAANEAGSSPADAPSGAEAAEVIIVDCSGSMNYPRTKMNEAKRATAAAIDALRDGVRFAIVAGTSRAQQVYPREGLVTADPRTKDAAKEAVQQLRADGGTAMGEWLTMARRLFLGHDDAIRHVILLTDGKNEHESAENLDAVLRSCTGQFVCDCRGVGTDWVVNELRKISSTLLGTVDIIADPAGLEADFRAMTTSSMSKAVADVSLRLWTPQESTVVFVKQVAPTVEDLTAKRTESGPRSGDYPTGAWGTESRDYHVCVRVPPGKVGDVMRAGLVSMVSPAGDVLAKGTVRAVWTDDMGLSTRISAEVAHYTGQAELASAIQEGLEARRSGDTDTATLRLGRAVALANESGNADTAALLEKVVDVVDPVTGTVRLKSKVDEADAMTLDTRSTKTSRVRGN